MVRYILENKKPVVCEDLFEWGIFMEHGPKVVARTGFINSDVVISTVFLGINHQFSNGKPLFFETMVFNGEHDGYQTRCSTWEEAEAQHKVAIALLQTSMN